MYVIIYHHTRCIHTHSTHLCTYMHIISIVQSSLHQYTTLHTSYCITQHHTHYYSSHLTIVMHTLLHSTAHPFYTCTHLHIYMHIHIYIVHHNIMSCVCISIALYSIVQHPMASRTNHYTCMHPSCTSSALGVPSAHHCTYIHPSTAQYSALCHRAYHCLASYTYTYVHTSVHVCHVCVYTSIHVYHIVIISYTHIRPCMLCIYTHLFMCTLISYTYIHTCTMYLLHTTQHIYMYTHLRVCVCYTSKYTTHLTMCVYHTTINYQAHMHILLSMLSNKVILYLYLLRLRWGVNTRLVVSYQHNTMQQEITQTQNLEKTQTRYILIRPTCR